MSEIVTSRMNALTAPRSLSLRIAAFIPPTTVPAPFAVSRSLVIAVDRAWCPARAHMAGIIVSGGSWNGVLTTLWVLLHRDPSTTLDALRLMHVPISRA